MKNPIRLFPKSLMITIFMIGAQALHGMCSSTVLWHNLSDGPGGFSPGVVNSVFNQNIDVQGTNALVNGITVAALTCDIVISVSNGDAVITGSGNRADGVATNPARLYLFADTGHAITFDLQNSLLFRGTANGATKLDLLITFSGHGTLNFVIAEGETVSFTSTPTSGGTKFFLNMENAAPIPTVNFQPGFTPFNQNIEVIIGERSCISFMSNNAALSTGQSIITFDPSNTGAGLYILRVTNDSCFDIAGHLITAPLNGNFLLTDIDLTTAAGLNAQMQILNVQAGAGVPSCLTVINTNQVLTNYMIDPFCDGSFAITGTQTGFILGANATLTINTLSYLNYIGASLNQTPIVFTPLANVQPDVLYKILNGDALSPQDFIKERNPSAFVVDGNADPLSIPAQITMNGSSAIYFRSGVDNTGSYTEFVNIGENLVLSFTINPALKTTGEGNIVLDVEGLLNVTGDLIGNTALNILSLEVTKTGCSVLPESDETQFPARTFTKDANGVYERYNSGCFLINNRMNLIDNMSLLHTDQNHLVLERDNLGTCDLNSEPTYVGGETFILCLPVNQPRPTIALDNSFIRFCTGAGFTGVDIRVPNHPADEVANGNVSFLIFYNNGRAIDNAYGRYVILGTNEGSFSTGGQLISADSHLDVFQEKAQGIFNIQQLLLDISYNTSCITEGITSVTAIQGQFAVQTIFLGNNSNISIGTEGLVGTDTSGNVFSLVTTPSLIINADYFSFETHGGSLGMPETSGTTGQGGIFVDTNGIITINRFAIANFSTMVVRSNNGIIDLPENQVNFRNRVGITQWNINLTDSAQRVLIPADQELSDFTMDWGAVIKDYTTTNSFVPYQPVYTPSACFCPPVTAANLRALPIVEGLVNQFQIKRSRIGDQASLLVDGGHIRELVFLLGCNTAEAPVGFIVVDNNGLVGLNSAHRNLDSTSAEMVLGINGVTLCAAGTGAFELNENVIINNVCHIVPGPNFGVAGPQTLTIFSEDPKELRILNTGVLDLSQFTNANQILEFAGNLQLVFEPGSRMILGGGTVVFTDNTNIALERVLDLDAQNGTSVSSLDPIRVKLIGNGTIVMEEAAQMLIHANTYFGIETDPTCTNATTINWVLNDQAKLEIGNDNEPGGVFQVGNTITTTGATVTFNLTIDGLGALFQINRQGMLGLGVGMVSRTSPFPNDWTVGCLANVDQISIVINEGTFRHNQIFPGNFSTAALLAIGPASAYTFNFDPVISNILGGANMVLLQSCLTNVQVTPEEFIFMDRAQDLLAKLLGTQRDLLVIRIDEIKPIMMKLLETMVGDNDRTEREREFVQEGSKLLKRYEMHRSIRMSDPELDDVDDGLPMIVRAAPLGVQLQPTVTAYSGVVSSNLTVGLFSSRDLLTDNSQPPQPTLVTPSALFNYLVTRDNFSYLSPKANVALTDLNVYSLAYIANKVIYRPPFIQLLGGVSADQMQFNYSLRRGAININLQDAISGEVNTAVQIYGAIAG